jgi:hypothetical protein
MTIDNAGAARGQIIAALRSEQAWRGVFKAAMVDGHIAAAKRPSGFLPGKIQKNWHSQFRTGNVRVTYPGISGF